MYKDSILKFHMVKPISFLSNEWQAMSVEIKFCTNSGLEYIENNLA